MKELILSIGSAVLAILLYKEIFPPKEVEHVIPHIQTVHDTVEKLPKWYADSVKVWKRRKSTTDTVQLYVTNTIVRHDTIPYYVNPDTALRPAIWPILSYHGGSSFGDTGVVSTFGLRTGDVSISRVFIPGILTMVEASESGMPKLTFEPFPAPKRPSFFYKVKMIGIGAGSLAVILTVVRALKP